MKDVKAYLSRVCSEGALADQWITLQQLYEKRKKVLHKTLTSKIRLWHELTLELLTFVKDDHFKQNGGLLELYENFLSDFEHRINQLSLAELVLVISQEMTDCEKAIEFLTKTQEKVKNSSEAKVLCLTAVGLLQLKANKLEDTKKLIKEAQALLDAMDSVSTVHGRFYDLSSNYSKITGSYNDYYRDALRYLGCMDLSSLPEAELQQRAFNLSLAALLGSDVYNFGELLSHEVLQYLQKTEHAWLTDVLYAFNSGDIQKFLDMRTQWSTQADLAANETALMQKITLLSLMELTFKRQSTDRSFPFSVIAKETRLPVHEVELLVMKALSIGLIKGSIDEVEQMVHVTWVQPRVLDKQQVLCVAFHKKRVISNDGDVKIQIETLRELLGTWSEKVKSSVYMVEDQVPELLVK